VTGANRKSANFAESTHFGLAFRIESPGLEGKASPPDLDPPLKISSFFERGHLTPPERISNALTGEEVSQKSNDQEFWKIAGLDYFFVYEGDGMARLERFELPTLGTGIRCSIRTELQARKVE